MDNNVVVLNSGKTKSGPTDAHMFGDTEISELNPHEFKPEPYRLIEQRSPAWVRSVLHKFLVIEAICLVIVGGILMLLFKT